MGIRAVAAACLVVLGALTACGQQSRSAESAPRPPASGADAAPDDRELGAALPGPADLGGIRGFSSCLAGDRLCAGAAGPHEGVSWARAVEGGRGEPGARWAEVSVRRYDDQALLRQDLRSAAAGCPSGDFVVHADPRGSRPRPPIEGTRAPFPVDVAGFRGTRCATESGRPGGARHAEHWIVVARDDVRVDVAAHSEDLVVALLEGYVERLG